MTLAWIMGMSRGRSRGRSLPALTLVVVISAPTSVAAAFPEVRRCQADAADSTEQLSDADRHFRRGVDLYEDGDMSAALVEFSRAYQIVPHFKILYNLGQVAYQRQDYVQSLDYLRRYLDEGGDRVSRERRQKVEQDVRRLELRIGRIEISTRAADDGAEILLDDVHIGVAPLNEPAVANVGQRRVELVRADGQHEVHLVDVVGAETVRTSFTRSAPRLSRDVSGADVATRPSGVNLLARSPDPGPSVSSSRRITPWLSWAAAGVLAGGAAVTGSMALSASRDLQQRREGYPLAPGDLDAPQRRARTLALVTDGLLLGTLVMTAVSTYLSVTAPTAESAPHRPAAATGPSSRARDSSGFGRRAGE
jgi:hypothetical protein